jgi:hypothetical protein
MGDPFPSNVADAEGEVYGRGKSEGSYVNVIAECESCGRLSPMGWRELSEDAQHVAFWLGLGGAVLASVFAGVYWNWWTYTWSVPPPIRALVVLAAVVLVFVLWYAVALVGHHYIGWPRSNPFDPSVVRSARQMSSPTRDRLVVLFRAHGEPAFTEATNLLSSIARTLEHSGSDVNGSVAALLTDGREVRQLKTRRLREELDNKSSMASGDDLQRQFGEFYEAYQWCSRWIHFAGKNANYPLATLHPYKQWRKVDADFLGELKRVVANHGMEILSEAVKDSGWGETIRESVSLAPETRESQRSLRADWLREADAFHALAVRDHYVLSPGTAMPGGISKVSASWYGSGEWQISGGLDANVRKDFEVQCRSDDA